MGLIFNLRITKQPLDIYQSGIKFISDILAVLRFLQAWEQHVNPHDAPCARHINILIQKWSKILMMLVISSKTSLIFKEYWWVHEWIPSFYKFILRCQRWRVEIWSVWSERFIPNPKILHSIQVQNIFSIWADSASFR